MATKGYRPKISLPDQLLNKLKEESDRSGLSQQEIIRRALDDWFMFREERLARQAAMTNPPGQEPAAPLSNGSIQRPQPLAPMQVTPPPGHDVDELERARLARQEEARKRDPYHYEPRAGEVYHRADETNPPPFDLAQDDDLFDRLGTSGEDVN